MNFAPEQKDRTAGGWFKAGFFFAIGAMLAAALPYMLLAVYIFWAVVLSQS